jgi:hypothetical protein
MTKVMPCTLILLVLLCLYSCSTEKSKTANFDRLLTNYKLSPAYADVKNTAKQDLEKWIQADLEEVHILTECKWKLSDDVFFNTKKNRAYLLLLIQDNNKSAELDYVYIMYAAREDTKWNVYFSSLPSYVFPRARFGSNKTISFEQLSKISRNELLKGYLDGSGELDDKFVNKTLTPDLLKRHVAFLNHKHK